MVSRAAQFRQEAEEVATQAWGPPSFVRTVIPGKAMSYGTQNQIGVVLALLDEELEAFPKGSWRIGAVSTETESEGEEKDGGKVPLTILAMDWCLPVIFMPGFDEPFLARTELEGIKTKTELHESAQTKLRGLVQERRVIP